MEDFFEYVDVVEEELENGDRNARVPRRYIRNLPDPRDFYSESEFRMRLRFSVNTVMGTILPLINEQLQKHDNRGLPTSPLIQLLIALKFYATGSFQLVAGDLPGVIQPAAAELLSGWLFCWQKACEISLLSLHWRCNKGRTIICLEILLAFLLCLAALTAHIYPSGTQEEKTPKLGTERAILL